MLELKEVHLVTHARVGGKASGGTLNPDKPAGSLGRIEGLWELESGDVLVQVNAPKPEMLRVPAAQIQNIVYVDGDAVLAKHREQTRAASTKRRARR